MEPPSQKKIFLNAEGDCWFDRNFDEERFSTVTPHIHFLSRFVPEKGAVLEIGCGFGKNLHLLSRIRNCSGFGIDPSPRAVEAGKAFDADLDLRVGTSDRLPFDDGFFDTVLFGFCLYLVDRPDLSRSVAEADRVLKDRGYLAIVDFDAKIPRQRPYRHADGVFSYKMDYAGLFLAYPHFSLADKHCFSHQGDEFVKDPTERIAATVLYKSHRDAYMPEKDR